MTKIDDLENLLPDEHNSIIDAFESMKELNEPICGKELKQNYEETIHNFRGKFMFWNAKYALSITPKMHILMTHVKQYI